MMRVVWGVPSNRERVALFLLHCKSFGRGVILECMDNTSRHLTFASVLHNNQTVYA